MSSWRCLEPDCDESGSGAPAEVDKAARLHAEAKAGPRHSTVTSHREETR